MVPIRYNVRSLLVRRLTTIATALGIALVVFVLAAAQMMSAGLKQAMTASGHPDTVVALRKDADNELSSTLTTDRLDALKAKVTGPMITEMVLVLTAELAGEANSISNVIVRGTPPEGLTTFRPEIKLTKGRMPTPGTGEAIVGTAIAGRFKGIDVGGQLELRTNRALTIVGEFSADGTSYESEVLADRDVVQQYMGRNYVSSARLKLADKNAFDALKLAVASDKNNEVKLMREKTYYEKQSEQTAGFLGGIGMFVAILFSLAAMIGAAITMNGAIANRTKEIGTLRALGFSRFSILISFVLESILIALAGGLIGLAAVFVLSLKTITFMNFQTFSDITFKFNATPGIIIGSLVFTFVMGLLGGLFPAIRATRVSPVEAMRN